MGYNPDLHKHVQTNSRNLPCLNNHLGAQKELNFKVVLLNSVPFNQKHARMSVFSGGFGEIITFLILLNFCSLILQNAGAR